MGNKKGRISSCTIGVRLPSSVYQFLTDCFVVSKVTLDIIAKTAFDYETDSLHNPNNELAVAYEKAIALQSGKNLFRMILLVLMPFGPRFLASEWAYNHRWFFESNWVLFGLLKDLSTLVSSMHTIRGVSKRMLDKKLQELSPIAATGDMDLIGKRDIMSILVRSKAEHERQMNTGKAAIGEYGMDEKAMVDQVVGLFRLRYPKFLTRIFITIVAHIPWLVRQHVIVLS